MDETGWRLQGQKRALWGAFTSKHAVLRIAESRHEDHARELLGDSTAIVTSDRWWAYNHLPLARRQVCWAHLRRDFQAHAEGLGAEKDFGEHGLRICEELFWSWEIYQHTRERKELKRRIRLLRRELKPILRQLLGQSAPLQAHARDRAQPAEGLAGAMDVHRHARRRADQQPRRTRAPRRGHLPQALPRQPMRGRRDADRPAALSAHHLPPPTPQPPRLPRRPAVPPRPRRPRPPPRLTRRRRSRADPLNAYGFSAFGAQPLSGLLSLRSLQTPRTLWEALKASHGAACGRRP